MLARMQSKKNSFIAAGLQNGTTIMEESLVICIKLNIVVPYNPAVVLLGIYSRAMKTCVHRKTRVQSLWQLYSKSLKRKRNQDDLQ